MSDENLRPQIIETLYNIRDSLTKVGISKKDLLLLLQARIRVTDRIGGRMQRMSIKKIEAVLDALCRFEKELIRTQKKFEKKEAE